MNDRDAITALRGALQMLLHATTHKDHPVESTMAIVALESTRETDRMPCPVCSARVK